MGDFPLDLKTDREKEDYHQNVIYELLDIHIAREEKIERSFCAMEVNLDVGQENFVVDVLGERQICQKHRCDHTGQKQNALKPRLTAKPFATSAKRHNTLVPGVDGN